MSSKTNQGNYLICSCGRRVNLIKWFKEELNKQGKKLYVTDSDKNAPALYHADEYLLLNHREYPNELVYIKDIIKFCKELNITNVLTLHDEQLLNLAKHKNEFILNDINLICSDYEVIEKCYDKTRYNEFPINQIPTVIVKDRFGSASGGLIRQPYIEGKEYNVQCYFDIHTKDIRHIFIQEKLGMRAGETDKSISTWDDEIENEIRKLDGLFKGIIDIDVIKSDKAYIIDINPRFGGGYPLVHHCEYNYISRLIENEDCVLGHKSYKYKLGVTMMKYNGVYFKGDGKWLKGK